jgi:hypothetical protein
VNRISDKVRKRAIVNVRILIKIREHNHCINLVALLAEINARRRAVPVNFELTEFVITGFEYPLKGCLNPPLYM